MDTSMKITQFMNIYVDKLCTSLDMTSIVNIIKAMKMIRTMDFILEKDSNHIIW